MNRRSFLALVSALAAFPALVRAKREELEELDEGGVLDGTDDGWTIEWRPQPKPWTALFVDEHGRFVHHSEQMPTISRWAVIPVHWIDPDGEPRRHVYDQTRFELVEVDEAVRAATYQYRDGPRPSRAWMAGLASPGWHLGRRP